MKLRNILITLSCCFFMLIAPDNTRAQDSIKAHYKELRAQTISGNRPELNPQQSIVDSIVAADSTESVEELNTLYKDSASSALNDYSSSLEEPAGLPEYNERQVSAEKLSSLKKNNDLQYSDNKEKETDTSWGSLIIGATLFYIMAHIIIFRWVLLVLLLAVIAYLLFRYLKKNGLSFFRKPLVVGALKEEVPEEELHSTNAYDQKIQEAISRSDVRQAIRWSYLHALFLLAEANMIKLAKDRTNKEYVRSVKNTPYYAEFSILTMDYEYVWYGGFDISQHEFEKMLEQFKAFNHQISKAGE